MGNATSYSTSTYLLGFHTFLMAMNGTVIYATGNILASYDPEEAKNTTGRAKLYKRWLASGMLPLGYVGYLGLTQPDLTPVACEICLMWHSLAGLSLLLAYHENAIDFSQGISQNPHILLSAGFASVVFGLAS